MNRFHPFSFSFFHKKYSMITKIVEGTTKPIKASTNSTCLLTISSKKPAFITKPSKYVMPIDSHTAFDPIRLENNPHIDGIKRGEITNVNMDTTTRSAPPK